MSVLRSRTSRLPLRVRLVAGFSAATLVVLLAAGAFVYWRVEYALDRGLDTDLTQATQTLIPMVTAGGTIEDVAAADATGVAWQVLTATDSLREHGGPAPATAMVDAAQLARAATRPHTFDLGSFLPASRDPFRLRVTPLPSTQEYLLVAVKRNHRDEALQELLLQLSLAGFATLVVTAFVGERLARAALHPVEDYRRRAAQIASGDADLRLEVPPDRHDEVTRLGLTFNDMLGSLQRALDRERRFVNEASHELRTPITLLRGRIQLARRRPRTQPEHEEILEELEVDLQRLAVLTEQLLDLGAVEGQHLDGYSDVATLAQRIVDRTLAAFPDLEVAFEPPSRPIPVAVPEVEVERILTNLLTNAATHGAPPLDLTVEEVGDWVQIRVTDRGPGMSPQMLEEASQRFTRSDAARHNPGTGLGLALVKAIVGHVGGDLRLCFDGHHSSHAHPVSVPCRHGAEMTATVLLPHASQHA